jgi:hypothetical protein
MVGARSEIRRCAVSIICACGAKIRRPPLELVEYDKNGAIRHAREVYECKACKLRMYVQLEPDSDEFEPMMKTSPDGVLFAVDPLSRAR